MAPDDAKTKEKPKGTTAADREKDTVKPNPQAKKPKPVEKPKALPYVPTDPIAARNFDRIADVEAAIAAVDLALLDEEEAADHSAEMLEARTMFQSLRYSEPFRYLIFAANEAGKKA